MKTLVTYSTKTGNTKKVAESIAKAIENSEIKDIAEVNNLDYDLIIVGTWIDKGTDRCKRGDRCRVRKLCTCKD